MSIPDPVLVRLATQPEALDLLLALADARYADARAAGGGWSAREHLAHLARHAQVFCDRIERICQEDHPALGRYKAEEDPEWPTWAALSWEEAVERWQKARADLTTRATALEENDLHRTGIHPVFGDLTLRQWLEFFLVHEGHHLYTALVRLGEARKTRARTPPVPSRTPHRHPTTHAGEPKPPSGIRKTDRRPGSTHRGLAKTTPV